MKKSTLLSMVLCLALFQLSAQNKNPEKEKEAKRLAATRSTISLEDLLKNKGDQYVVTAENVSRLSGVRNVYLKQAINGLEIYGTESSIHFDKTGKVLTEHNRFLKDAATTIVNNSQTLSAKQAVISVANQMGYKITGLKEVKKIGGVNKIVIFGKAGISSEDIPVKLMYYYKEGIGTQLVWELSVAEKRSSDWWNFLVSASSGKILEKVNWTVSCNIMDAHNEHAHSATVSSPFVGPMNKPAHNISASSSNRVAPPVASYRVFAMPLESPNHGGRTLVSNPENLTASPFGWHDTNGVEGAEFTSTRGNNTDAYDDDDGNNLPDNKYAFSPGGNLIFDFPLNTSYSSGDQSENAAITNLFYWTNIIHDVSYQYGFDEAGGNFQQNNYGKGGLGNDPVNAEAQDGSGTCNANFGTPPDGARPIMQMYVCGNRDGDLDSGVIVHEYGHGISNRLTGGPLAVGCLTNSEQMGEGWSDFYALMLTMKSGDMGSNSRGIGTWLLGQGSDGPGIRVYPYSTNFGVNPHTYASVSTAIIPHGVGEIWATMLWEMTWEIMATEPFDSDIYNGNGGNNVALALVTEGLRLQPCSPGFVDGRDAILAADQALYGGAHICAIWAAFARRGLGYSANQGSTNNIYDGIEAFDLPPSFGGLNVIDEICLAGGVVTGLSGGSPEGGVYSGIGVTDDGNGTTFTFDPTVNGEGSVTVTYTVDSACSGGPESPTDTITITNNPPEIICMGSGTVIGSGSQTSDVGGPIPDGLPEGITFNMDVSENVVISDLNVYVNINHTWVGDLVVSIKSPSGTTVTIIDRIGKPGTTYGCNGNDIDATLDDEASSAIELECGAGTPSISGAFIPNNPLSSFDGENTMGTWQLMVADNASGDSGSLVSWGITFENELTAPILDVTLDGSGNAIVDANDLLYNINVDCGTYSVLAGTPLSATVTFTCADIGMNNVPVQVTNGANATSSCTAIVNVIAGSGGGTISCPGDIVQDNDEGSCGAIVEYTIDAPTECGGSGTLTQTAGLPSGSMFPIGTTTNTYEYNDGSNPIQTCSFNVTINDTEGPNVICQNITIQLDASGNATIVASEVDGGSTDNCGIQSISVSPDSFSCADLGDKNYTLTITDVNGNESSCTGTISVEDPLLACVTENPEDFFITTWKTNVSNESITIPTNPGQNYNYTVDWGDGTVALNQVGNSTHTYASAGIHTVMISGEFPGTYFHNGGDRLKLQSIVQWGTITWKTMNAAFAGCENMVSTATDMPDISMVTDMYGTFAYCRKFNGDANFGNWDVSNVTNLAGTFAGGSIFNYPIGNWNVGNVTTMENLFFGATIFNQDLNGWNVGNVKNMKNTFSTAMGFNSPIDNWNVSQVTNMSQMFYHANKFDQNLGNWNVSNVTDMTNMFKNVTLSTSNYDAILMGWSVQPLKSNVRFSAGFSTYCMGESARQDIINTFHWNITDGGKNCGDPIKPNSNIEEDGLASIVLHPNPMVGSLILSNPFNVELEKITIYDLTGRMIQTIDLKGMSLETTVDVSHLSSATYMILISGKDGQVSKLMIKE